MQAGRVQGASFNGNDRDEDQVHDRVDDVTQRGRADGCVHRSPPAHDDAGDAGRRGDAGDCVLGRGGHAIAWRSVTCNQTPLMNKSMAPNVQALRPRSPTANAMAAPTKGASAKMDPVRPAPI
jgi:hypothetical protein